MEAPRLGSGGAPTAQFQRKVPFVEFAHEPASSTVVEQVTSYIRATIHDVNEAGMPISPRVTKCLQISRYSPSSLLVAHLLSRLGVKLMLIHRYKDAENLHRRALCIAASILGSGHAELSFSLDWLGQALFFQQNYMEALLVCFAAKKIVVDEMGERHPNVCGCLINLATVYEARGWFLYAMQMREEAALLYFSLSRTGQQT